MAYQPLKVEGSWEDKGVHTFPKGIWPKVNVIARLELAYYDSAVQRLNHYTTRTPPQLLVWKFTKEKNNRVDALFTIVSFKRISIMTSPCMSKKTVSMIFFTDRDTWNIFMTESECASCPWTVNFIVAKSGLAYLLTFFFTKACLSVQDTHSSVNLTWFVLLSHQKFDDRPLFKLGALWFATSLNSVK